MRWLAVAVGAHLLTVLLIALREPAMRAHPVAGVILTALFALIVPLIARRSARARAGHVALAALALVFVSSRLAWVLAVSTQPVSDFAGYHALAVMFSQGKVTVWWPLGNLVAAWGYPLALGQVLRILPRGADELLVAKLFNVVLGLASLVLLDRIAERAVGRRTALLAALLFVAWPGQLFFTSVLASEHLAVVALLLAVDLVLPLLGDRPPGWARAALAGIVLAAAFLVRSALIVAPLSVATALLVSHRPFRRAVALAFVVGATFLLATRASVGGLRAAYGASPVSSAWWSLLTGTNVDSDGSFSTADRDHFFGYRSIAEADAFARAEIVRRLTTEPAGIARLFWRKSINLWRADDYACFWSTVRLAGTGPAPDGVTHAAMDVPAQSFHLAVLAFAVLGCWRSARSGVTPGIALMLVLIAAGTLLHALVESQARYHFVMQPWVLVLAAFGASAPRRTVSAGPLAPGALPTTRASV
jgi:hypothetical protein